jgi:hypothetical protein
MIAVPDGNRRLGCDDDRRAILHPGCAPRCGLFRGPRWRRGGPTCGDRHRAGVTWYLVTRTSELTGSVRTYVEGIRHNGYAGP